MSIKFMKQQDPNSPILYKLETDNFIIRLAEPGDGKLLYEGLMETIEVLKSSPNTWPWAHDEQSEELSEKFCYNAYSRALRLVRVSLLIFNKTDNIFLGVVDAKRPNLTELSWETSAWIRLSYQNKNILKEVMSALQDWLYSNNNQMKIYFGVDKNNVQMQSVAKKSDFSKLDSTSTRNDSVFDIYKIEN